MTVRSARPKAPANSRGLTLMEMLVVLTLVSLLGTSLVQALGFFAARYEAVTRSHRAADFSAMQQRWFETSVGGIVPVGVFARAFDGGPAGFVGTTLQPLAAEPGLPTVARWAIAAEQPPVLLYAEEGATGGDAQVWRLPAPARGRLSFQYADRGGAWHNEWPPKPSRGEWTPRLVRLVVDDQETLWVAQVETSPFPLPNEGQFIREEDPFR